MCISSSPSFGFPLSLSVCLQECLLDMLVRPEGLRLRDRISHGEVCIVSGPQILPPFPFSYLTFVYWGFWRALKLSITEASPACMFKSESGVCMVPRSGVYVLGVSQLK